MDCLTIHYADDTQLYMTMDHSNKDWRDGLARIELCVSESREWMNQNMVKLNDDKTELIVITSTYTHDLYNDLSITIGDNVVDCSTLSCTYCNSGEAARS